MSPPIALETRDRRSLPVISARGQAFERAEPRAVRVSITDRCDLACVYCRPHRRDGYLPAERRMPVSQWKTLIEGLVARGVRRVRMTGGEPLLHPQVVEIAAAIAAVPGVEDLAITTNATQLTALARPLRDAGVRRLNVSLDSLDARRFFRMTRGGRLDEVLEGLAAARAAGFDEIKTNTVVVGAGNDDPGNEDEIAAIARWALDFGATPRFLELMTVGEGARMAGRVVPFAAMRALLSALLVEDDPVRESDRGPAVYVPTRDRRHRIGFVTGTSENFCRGCDRLRVSSDGRLRPCLATNDAIDVSAAVRARDFDAIARSLADAWAFKPQAGWQGCCEGSAAGVDMRATGG